VLKKIISIFTLSFILLMGFCPAFSREVEDILRRPEWYHGREVRVTGYIADVEYTPHGLRGVLNIKLVDRLEVDEEVEEYLLCQEVGYNIGVLTRVLDYAKVAWRRGEKVEIEGTYDKYANLLEMEGFRYRDYRIYTDYRDIPRRRIILFYPWIDFDWEYFMRPPLHLWYRRWWRKWHLWRDDPLWEEEGFVVKIENGQIKVMFVPKER
jgi:hypothetical protein